MLLLLGGVSNWPLVEPFTGTSGPPLPRWAVTTVGGATVGLNTNRLQMVVPAPGDVGQALLADIIPVSTAPVRTLVNRTTANDASAVVNGATSTAGELFVVIATYAGGGTPDLGISDSQSLSWTERATDTFTNGNKSMVSIFTATANGTATNITVNAGAGSTYVLSVEVYRYANHGGIGAAVHGAGDASAGGTGTVNLTITPTTGANSETLASIGLHEYVSTPLTPAPGWTELYDTATSHSSGNGWNSTAGVTVRHQTQVKTGAVSATSWSWLSGDEFSESYAAVEILPATIIEYRGSYTYTVGTNQTPGFNFRGDGIWQSSGNRHLFTEGLSLVPNTVSDNVVLFSTTTSGGVSTSVALGSVAFTIGATDTVNVHVITTGTAVYWTAWLASGSEPAAWQTATDSNHSARKRMGLALQSPTAAPTTTGYWDDVAVNDVPSAVGALARTLGALTSAISSASGAAGTLARTLSDATMSAVGSTTGSSSLNVTLGAVTIQAAGAHGVSGTLAQTLGALTGAATGTTPGASGVLGTLAVTLGELETAAPLTDDTGAVITDDASNPILVRGAEGAHGIGGVLASTLGALTSTAVGVTGGANGTLAQTLGALTSAADGTFGDVGTAAVTLGALTSAATGTVGVTGSLAVTLGNTTSAASGTHTPGSSTIAGNVAVTLGALTSAASGSSVAGDVNRTLADLTCVAAGTVTLPTVIGTAAITLGAITLTTDGSAGVSGTLDRTLSDLVGSAVGSSVAGTLNVTLGDLVLSGVGAGAIVDFQPVSIRDHGHHVSLREMA